MKARSILTVACSIVLLAGVSPAQSTPPAASPAATAAPADKLSPEQLDQLVAPIALYPDSLLTQVLMASTYPLEIVQADRWVKANASLKGDALAKALEQQTWDPSVKSLVNFPDVLGMMSEKLDITSKLGDAFISQQKDVMDSVQRLRSKAKAAGNLESNQQQTVTVNQAPAGSTTTQTIVIQPAQTEVVYVPTYNPTVVYGAWPYPAYPPYPYYPPSYVASNVLSFGVGVACGVAWGYAWGNCNWNNSNVNINVNQNINYNNQINRNNYQANFNKNNVNFQNGQGQWQHNPQHRQGVPYSNRATPPTATPIDRGRATPHPARIAADPAHSAALKVATPPARPATVATPAAPPVADRPLAHPAAGRPRVHRAVVVRPAAEVVAESIFTLLACPHRIEIAHAQCSLDRSPCLPRRLRFARFVDGILRHNAR
jgi:hypothetical protein